MTYEIPEDNAVKIASEPPYDTFYVNTIVRPNNLSTAITGAELKARLHKRLLTNNHFEGQFFNV